MNPANSGTIDAGTPIVNRRSNLIKAAARDRWHWTALAGVLLLASVLRFAGITGVGIRFDDEAAYACDARLWYRCAQFLTDAGAIRAVFSGDHAAIQQRKEGHGIDFDSRYPKPCQGYTIPAACVMLVMGDTPDALFVANALLGTLSVLVLYAVGVVLFDRLIAVCGALLLAVSPYHLLYARSALADTSAGFFVLLGVLFWAMGHSGRWPWRRAYVLSGLALGWAFTCHFRSAYVPMVLVAVELGGMIRPAEPCEPFVVRCWSLTRRWLCAALAFAAPAVILETVFRAARYTAVLVSDPLPLATFLEGCWYWAKLSYAVEEGTTTLRPHLTVITVFVTYFVHWHGVAAVLLAGGGLIVTMRRAGPATLPAIMIITTVVLLLFQRNTVGRAFSAMVPFACLCAAVAVGSCAALVCRRDQRAASWTALFVVSLAAIPGVISSVRLCTKRSDIESACRYVAQRGGSLVVPARFKYRLYLDSTDVSLIGGERFHQGDPPETMLAELRAAGVRWLITDPQYFHYEHGDPIFQWWDAMREHLEQTQTPTAEFPHMTDYRWEFLSEGPGLDRLPAMRQAGAGPIRIYDLQHPLAIAAHSHQPTSSPTR